MEQKYIRLVLASLKTYRHELLGNQSYINLAGFGLVLGWFGGRFWDRFIEFSGFRGGTSNEVNPLYLILSQETFSKVLGVRRLCDPLMVIYIEAPGFLYHLLRVLGVFGG